MIPVCSPKAQYLSHAPDIDAAIRRVLLEGQYVLGTEVDCFEAEFAEYIGVDHGVGVGNGTDALMLALKGLGIGPGDEVVAPSHTAVATVAAILMAGALPVLVDIDESTYTIDPARVQAAITSRTRAVVAVHLYGHPADLTALGEITANSGCVLVEDCAQAIGAEWCGRRVGQFGQIACFSFFPTKNLGALGDGGMVVTNDAQLAGRIRRLRQYGWDADRRSDEPGVNSRLDEVQAAVLRVKLRYLDADTARRRQIAEIYSQGLDELGLDLPQVHPDGKHAFHLYVVRCDDRDRLRDRLAVEEVGTGIHYPVPVHLRRGYRQCWTPASGLPVTERVAKSVLSLPMYPELAGGEVAHVCAIVRDALV